MVTIIRGRREKRYWPSLAKISLAHMKTRDAEANSAVGAGRGFYEESITLDPFPNSRMPVCMGSKMKCTAQAILELGPR